MLPLLFVAFAISSVLSVSHRAFSDLSISLAGASVQSISVLTIQATVANSGSTDVKVLKYGTVLDYTHPTRSFTITKEDGTPISFIGAKLSVVSLSELTDDAFVIIPAGANVTVLHQSSLYDFRTWGYGKYVVNAVSTLPLVDGEHNTSGVNTVEVMATPLAIEIQQDNARDETIVHTKKRAQVRCRDPARASFISASYAEAKVLANRATSYIARNGQNGLYSNYWGPTPTATVTQVFSAVAEENSPSRTLSCHDSLRICDGNLVAYIFLLTGNIYYCDIFFAQLAAVTLCNGTTVSSRSVRGGTTLHELTHGVANTEDVVYGCEASQTLPEVFKGHNADNYNCFSTQVYQDTRC